MLLKEIKNQYNYISNDKKAKPYQYKFYNDKKVKSSLKNLQIELEDLGFGVKYHDSYKVLEVLDEEVPVLILSARPGSPELNKIIFDRRTHDVEIEDSEYKIVKRFYRLVRDYNFTARRNGVLLDTIIAPY